MRLLVLLALVSGCGAPDKFNHYVVGAGVSRAVTEVTGNQWAGCAAAIVAGVAKEVYDSRTHAPERMDAYATAGGGCQFSVAF